MLDYYKPKYFVLENVQKIHTIKNGSLLDEMKQALRDIGGGYILHTWNLIASDYGLPQKRNRIFFCGIRRDLSEAKNISEPPVVDLKTAKFPTTWHLLEKSTVDPKHYIPLGSRKTILTKPSNWEGDVNIDNPTARQLTATMSKWHRANQDNYFSDAYITGTDPYNRPSVNMETEPIRRITPLEGFRLQGFPDKYAEIACELGLAYSTQYKLIGNALERLNGGTNTLLYGVPGSGKSWTIEHEYCHVGSVVERLVFHPDYTNADFIGQILPVVDTEKQVTYEFTPGPFTTVLRDAYTHPMSEYILIIEEVNRGNAPAIFGEVFQLLDRTVEPKAVEGITYPIGTSEYGVTHKYMAEIIYGDPTHKVRIPSNLSIVGTMNTSDQNVFTLDTAFQRRWRMRLIENNFDNVRASLANVQILDTEVTWKIFCERINAIIVGNKAKMASAEDKRLGVYFVHENDVTFDQRAVPSEGYTSLLTEYNDLLRNEATGYMAEDKKKRLIIIRDAVMHNRMFPEKVIKYLWDDAFKFNPEALFDTENMESLEQVIRTFVYSRGRERFKIFKPTVRASLYPDAQA